MLLAASPDVLGKAVKALAPTGKRLKKDKLEVLISATQLTDFGTLSGWSWAPAGGAKHYTSEGTEWFSEAQLSDFSST